MGFKEEHPSVLLFLIFVFWVSDIIGWLFVNVLFILPSAWILSVGIPINPLILVTVPLSIFMLLKLFESLNYFKNRTTHLTLVLIFIYSLITWIVSTENPRGITFDIEILRFFSRLVFFTAILIFLEWIPMFRFSREKAALDSIYFAAGILWLSPFLAELCIWSRWYITGDFWGKVNYMTMGGAGTQDILFWLGFWGLSTMSYFHALMRIPRIKGIFDHK